MSQNLDGDERLDLAGVVALTAATTIGFEQIRVYVSYLVWIVGETTSRPVLGALALAPFLAVGLAGGFLRTIGPRRGFLLSAVWLALGSLAERSSAVPMVDLWLGAACVLFWGWCVVGAAVTIRRGLALALVSGAALDLALRLAFLTIDLPWTDHPVATGLAIVLAAATVLGAQRAAPRASGSGEPNWPLLAPLLGLGPWLAMTMLITGNPSQVMARTGAGFGLVAGALAIGQAVAVQLGSGMAARPAMAPGLTVIGGLASVSVVPLWNGWAGGPMWAILAAVASGLLLAGALRPAEGPAERATASATGLWCAGGLALFVSLAYVYYAAYGPPTLIVVMVAGLVIAGLAGAGLTVLTPELPPVDTIWPATAAAGVLLVIGTFRALSWSEQVATEVAPDELTIVTYNIRAGFGSDNRWDLERTARVIEAERPDLVLLNEVARGWLVASGADQALWLSQRVGMQLIFGAAAGDLHGNALLTRWRADGGGYRYVGPVPSALPRGAVVGEVAVERGRLLVAGTHLDYPEAASATRLAQMRELLTLVGNHRPAFVLGDMNAAADSAELDPLREAGFIDAPAAVGMVQRTWPAHNPDRRIDHVFVSPDARPIEARVVETSASDHLPVVVRVRLG